MDGWMEQRSQREPECVGDRAAQPPRDSLVLSGDPGGEEGAGRWWGWQGLFSPHPPPKTPPLPPNLRGFSAGEVQRDAQGHSSQLPGCREGEGAAGAPSPRPPLLPPAWGGGLEGGDPRGLPLPHCLAGGRRLDLPEHPSLPVALHRGTRFAQAGDSNSH